MDDPTLRDSGEDMADRLIAAPKNRQPAAPLLARLRSVSGGLKVARSAGVECVISADLGLPLWRIDGQAMKGGVAEGWVEHDGHLSLIPGSTQRPLRLAVPLTGTFELSCEATDAGLIEYGGQSFAPPSHNSPRNPGRPSRPSPK